MAACGTHAAATPLTMDAGLRNISERNQRSEYESHSYHAKDLMEYEKAGYTAANRNVAAENCFCDKGPGRVYVSRVADGVIGFKIFLALSAPYHSVS